MSYYKKTTVHWSKSQTKIVQMLQKQKIYNTRFTNLKDKFAMEFMAQIEGHKTPIGVRLIIPCRYSGEDQKKLEQDLNRLHRVLFHHLKAKFAAIESGLTEFMEEFMPHLIIMDKQGNSTTMGQQLLPQYKNTLESGSQGEFKLLS